MRRYSLLLLLICISCIVPGYSAERMIVAVLDLRADGVASNTAVSVSDRLRSNLDAVERFTVVKKSAMNAVLRESGFQEKNCSSRDCAARLGRLMSAGKVLIGVLSSRGESVVMAVRIVDVDSGLAEHSARVSAPSTDMLMDSMGRIAGELSSKIEGVSIEIEKVSSWEQLSVDVTVRGCYLMPRGDLGDILDPGYGMLLDAPIRDFPIKYLDLGITLGYLAFPGKTDGIDRLQVIPVFLTAGYRFNLSAAFTISPRVSLGYSYNSVAYDHYAYDSIIGKDTEKNRTEEGFEPVFTAGMMLTYSLMGYYCQIGTEYSSIREKSGGMDFLAFSAGIGMRL